MEMLDGSLRDFLGHLASADPTPGGGTAAAAAGAMGVALLEMVCHLTLGRDKFAAVAVEMKAALDEVAPAREEFLRLAVADSAAFTRVMTAIRLPKATDSEQHARRGALAAAYREATEVPLATANLALTQLAVAVVVAAKGNPNAQSDAAVGGLLLYAATNGALQNVVINSSGLQDPVFVQTNIEAVAEARRRAEVYRLEILRLIS